MNNSQISVRYARAIFDVAEKQKKLDAVNKNFDTLFQLVRESKELKQLLKSPVIGSEKKYDILNNIFKKDFDPLTLKSMEMIFKNKREAHIQLTILKFNEIYYNAKNIIAAELTTAIEIKKELKDKIVKLIKDKYKGEVKITDKVDEKIIGGFILKVYDTQYNSSVSHHLRKIKTKLLTSA